MLCIGLVEAADGAACEAHRLEHLGVARVAVGDAVAFRRRLARGHDETAGHDFADHGEHDEDECAREGQRAEHRMKEVDEGQIDRHPGQIEQRRGTLAAEEATDGVDVPPALQRFGGGEAKTRHVDGDAMRQRCDLAVDPGANPHQHLGADDVEGTLE